MFSDIPFELHIKKTSLIDSKQEISVSETLDLEGPQLYDILDACARLRSIQELLWLPLASYCCLMIITELYCEIIL